MGRGGKQPVATVKRHVHKMNLKDVKITTENEANKTKLV